MRKPDLLPAAALAMAANLAFAGCSQAATQGENAQGKNAGAGAHGPAGEPVSLEAGSLLRASAHATLAEPWAIAVEPGTGNLVITQKAGTARYFQPATGEMREIGGLPQVAYGGQGGLGDVAFAPDYATSGMIYLTWAKPASGPASGNTIQAVAGRGRFACDATACTISGLEEIWQQQPAVEGRGHFSHRLAFSPDHRHLFISSGDRMKKDPAQDNANTLGTVVRLNLDGTPASGNPFAAQGSPSDQIWSYGHRNVLGLQFDLAGELWGLEHGPAGGDELNLVKAGRNFGWPVRSFGNDYNGAPIPDHNADDGFAQPAIHWTPVIGPGGMIFYRGDLFADWRGQALIANLTTRSIVRVAADAAAGTAREVARHPFPARLRDIDEGPDGALWVIEDGPQGRLLRLVPAR